jgi:hypothetical protein
VFFALVRQELEEASIHPNYEEQWREREEEDDFFCGVPASSNKAMLGLHVPGVGESTEQECLVCLEDFKEGDKLRMMPCSHSFHERCIFSDGSVLAAFAHAAALHCPPLMSNVCWMSNQHV